MNFAPIAPLEPRPGDARSDRAGRQNLFARGLAGLEQLLLAVIGLAAPSRCAACGLEDGGDREKSGGRPWLCSHCQQAVPTSNNRCGRCGGPVGPFVDSRTGCARCSGDRFHFETVIPLGVYESDLRLMCLSVKQPGKEELAAALPELLWKRDHAELLSLRAELVVPVPHHWTAAFRRSAHAPETLAAVLGRRLRVRFAPHILAKVRWTQRQTGLPRTRRRGNLKGAFHVPPRFRRDVEGRRVLLVDDILTTGATADEGARALRRAGAASVVVAVIARGLGKEPLRDRTG